MGVSRARVGLRRACCRFLLFALSKLLDRGGANCSAPRTFIISSQNQYYHLCTLCYITYSLFALSSALSFYMYESSREKNKKTLKFLKNKKKTHFFLLTTTSIITNSYSSRKSAGVVATTQSITTTNTKRDQERVFLFSRDLFSLQARSLYLFLFVSAYLILISLAIVIELTRSVVRLSAFAYGLSIA